MTSSVILALSRKLRPLASTPLDATQETQSGTFGTPSVWTCTSTPTSNKLKTPSCFYKSLRTVTAPVPWLPVALRCALEQWKEPFVPLGRRLPHWAAGTHVCNPRANWIYAYPDNSPPTRKKILHQRGSSPSPSLL
jgi:hypothetical protein